MATMSDALAALTMAKAYLDKYREMMPMRSAGSDLDTLEYLQGLEEDGEIVSARGALVKFINADLHAGFLDDDGYMYQGFMEEVMDHLDRLGLLKDDEEEE